MWNLPGSTTLRHLCCLPGPIALWCLPVLFTWAHRPVMFTCVVYLGLSPYAVYLGPSPCAVYLGPSPCAVYQGPSPCADHNELFTWTVHQVLVVVLTLSFLWHCLPFLTAVHRVIFCGVTWETLLLRDSGETLGPTLTWNMATQLYTNYYTTVRK